MLGRYRERARALLAEERAVRRFAVLEAFFREAPLDFFVSSNSLGTISGGKNIQFLPYDEVAPLVPSSFSTSTRTARSTGVGCHWMGQ